MIGRIRNWIISFLGLLSPETIDQLLDQKVEKAVIRSLEDLLVTGDLSSETGPWTMESKDRFKNILRRYYTELMVTDVSMVFEEAKKQFFIDVAPEKLISEEFLKRLSTDQLIQLVKLISKLT